MYRSVLLWSLGQAIGRPKTTALTVLMLTTPRGRILLNIILSSAVRTATYTGSRIAKEIVKPIGLDLWLAFRPHAILTAPVLLATTGAIGAHQSMSELGSGPRTGEVQPLGSVAPSYHLQSGKPWWEDSSLRLVYNTAWHAATPF